MGNPQGEVAEKAWQAYFTNQLVKSRAMVQVCFRRDELEKLGQSADQAILESEDG
jgi:hypothetical protein